MIVRKTTKWVLVFVLAGAFCVGGSAPPPEIVALTSTADAAQRLFAVEDVPAALVSRVRNTTWHEGCPAPLEELKVLKVTYWNFSGLPQQGMLLVNRAASADLQFIFQQLFAHGFMIERMRPVEDYDGNDDRSMAADNTSAFNCRDVTGHPGKFSNHSWGRAIDINPLVNPMVLHGKPLPPEGAQYLDRTKASPGSILANSFIVKLFESRGWTWGGGWTNPDFQHFEKPVPEPLN